MRMKVDITRWMYRSGRPNGVAAALNRWWAIVWSAGLGPNRLAALEVRGRRYLRVAPGGRPHSRWISERPSRTSNG